MSSKSEQAISLMVNTENLEQFTESYARYLNEFHRAHHIENVIIFLIHKLCRATTAKRETYDTLIQYYLDCFEHIAKHPSTNHQKLGWIPITDALIRDFHDTWGRSDAMVRLIQHLITHYPSYDINRMSPYSGINLLMSAVHSEINNEHVVKGLLDLGADIHMLSLEYGRPIHFLSEHDNNYRLNKLIVLLNYGADPGEEIVFNEYMGTREKTKGLKSLTSLTELFSRQLMQEELDICKQYLHAKEAVSQVGIGKRVATGI